MRQSIHITKSQYIKLHVHILLTVDMVNDRNSSRSVHTAFKDTSKWFTELLSLNLPGEIFFRGKFSENLSLSEKRELFRYSWLKMVRTFVAHESYGIEAVYALRTFLKEALRSDLFSLSDPPGE